MNKMISYLGWILFVISLIAIGIMFIANKPITKDEVKEKTIYNLSITNILPLTFKSIAIVEEDGDSKQILLSGKKQVGEVVYFSMEGNKVYKFRIEAVTNSGETIVSEDYNIKFKDNNMIDFYIVKDDIDNIVFTNDVVKYDVYDKLPNSTNVEEVTKNLEIQKVLDDYKFINSFDGHKFYVSSWLSAKAYFNGDIEYINENSIKSQDDLSHIEKYDFSDVEYMILREVHLDSNNIAHATYEVVLNTQDNGDLYFNIAMVQDNSEWKIDSFYIEP